MLPPPNYTNTFSILLLHITGSPPSTFAVDADLSCQWYRRPSQALFPVQLFARPGVNRLFSTGLVSYDSILSQIHISGEISTITSLELCYILGNGEYCRETFAIRSVLAVFSSLCLLCYSVSLLAFAQGGVKMEHMLSLASLLVSVCANSPLHSVDRFRRSFIVHCLNSSLRGIFGSFNTVCLFLFVFHANGGEMIGFAFLMSLLYILGNSIQIVTSDTRILALLFDGNLDVWMFFVSVSLMGRIGLFTLQIYHALFACSCGWTARRHLATAYAFMIAIQVAVAVLQSMFYYVNGYGNFALDFFADYLLQTFFAFAFADVHWPQVQRKMPLVDQHLVVEDHHFAPAFSDSQFCL
jgi:hypothetical protein